MIQIMDVTGLVRHTVNNDGTPLFRQPGYIAVSMEGTGQMIHVPDW